MIADKIGLWNVTYMTKVVDAQTPVQAFAVQRWAIQA